MKTKIIQFIPAMLALLVVGFRYLSQWCIVASLSCYGTWVHWIYIDVTDPLYNFALYFLPIALVLIFVPRHIFKSWLKLAAWAVPLSFIFMATTDVTSHRVGIDIFPFYRDDAARLAGQAFAASSLVVFLFSFVRTRIYESDKDKRGVEYAIADTKDLALVFATVIGFFSAAFCSFTLLTNSLSLDAFLNVFVVLVLSNVYALGYAAVFAVQKARAHAPLGFKLVLSLSLLGLTITTVIATVFAAFVLYP